MKYKNFNDSCAFAGVSNMLLDYEIEVEDFEVAVGAGCPYIFKYVEEEESYITGVYLQSQEYFSNFLGKYDLKLTTTKMEKNKVTEFLEGSREKSMVGIKQPKGSGHALIYLGKEGESFKFLNNKFKNSVEEEILYFTKEELLDRLLDEVNVGRISKGAMKPMDMVLEIKDSLRVLERYKRDVIDFCEGLRLVSELRENMDKLFRVVFLQLFDMMYYISEMEIYENIKRVREEFLGAIKMDRELILKEHMDMKGFSLIIHEYERVLKGRLRELEGKAL